jgi:hypothetical protein
MLLLVRVLLEIRIFRILYSIIYFNSIKKYSNSYSFANSLSKYVIANIPFDCSFEIAL